MKIVGLVARPDTHDAAVVAKEIRGRFPSLELLVEENLGAQLGWPTVKGEELGWRADVIVVLGGDGTLIHAARLIKGRAVPIVGVNLGSLGFMTEIPAGEAVSALDDVLAGRARVESRMKLSCRLFRDGRLLLEDEVLNDVVINKSALATLADHETWFDGAYVASFKSDGIILATPTGSTAYSLSAGGPIVHPTVDCVILTPICPHALTQRPIVVPGDQLVRVSLPGDVKDMYLSIDGKEGHPLVRGDRLEVQKSPNRVYLVRNSKLDYFAILRQKLRWGER